MDEFGQIGPEKGDYDQDVRTVATRLRMTGRAVTFALTHRLTRQQVTVALENSVEVIGAERGGGPPGTRGGEYAFVAVDLHGAYWFRVDLDTHPSYFEQRLGIHRVDAETLSDFMSRLGSALGYKMGPGVSRVTEVVSGGD